MSVWQQLPKSSLEERLGSELLARVQTILPLLSQGSGLTAESLYATSTLVRLFEAFAASTALLDQEFRRVLFSSCRSGQLDAILLALGETPDAYVSHFSKVQKLTSLRWQRNGLATAVAEALTLPEALLPPPAGKKQASLLIPQAAEPLRRLKDYQSHAFHRVMEILEPPNGRVILQMPTGSGKTKTAMEVVAAFLAQREHQRIIWLAHSSELCDQAADALLSVWPHYAEKPLRFFRSWDADSAAVAASSTESWMAVCSLQMAHELRKRNRLPKVDLVVVDEAHKVLAPTYKAAVLALKGEDTRVLGLTATPGRSVASKDENEGLAEFFFGQLVSTEGPAGLGAIAFLRRKRVLAGLDREVLRTGVTVTLPRSAGKNGADDVPEAVLNVLAQSDLRSAEIAKRIARAANEGKACLHFATSVAHSRFVTALLSFMGVPSAHLDGGSPPSHRADAIERFRAGELRVLSNFGVLTTGFDAPAIDFLCISRPTTSVVLYSQMLGRGLRGPAIGGTDRCQIVDVVDNIVGMPGIEDLYGYFDEYYSG